MNTKLIATLALTAALNIIPVNPANAGGKEKCYGIAEAGQNDCGNLAGTHSCAGKAKTDNDIGEWKLVAKGTCKTLGGVSKSIAQEKLNNS